MPYKNGKKMSYGAKNVLGMTEDIKDAEMMGIKPLKKEKYGMNY